MSAAFVGGVKWELLSYIQIFSKRTVLGSEQIEFCASVQVVCPPPVGAGSTCVAHTTETFPVEPGEGLLKQAAFFQVSLFPEELVISGALCIPGRTKSSI